MQDLFQTFDNFGNRVVYDINTPEIAPVAGNLGSYQTQTSVPENTDITQAFIDGGMITTGYITLNTEGHIKSGKSNYADTAAGWWLGKDGIIPKFSIGNSTDYLKWDGSNVKMLCSSSNAIHIKHGSDILLEHGGDIKFTSVTAPTACTVALAGVPGNVNNNDHYYKITFVNEAGETELGSISNVVTVTDKTVDGQVNLTNIPVSTSGSVIKRRIYRTKSLFGYDYYLLATINDNTTTTYTDNTADADLTGEEATYMKNNSFGKILVDNVVMLRLAEYNTYIGHSSGEDNTTGYYNTAIGFHSLKSNTTGYFNTALGIEALSSNTDGDTNVAIGPYSLASNTTGIRNVSIGHLSLRYNTTGDYNTAVGGFSLYTNTTGYENSANGYASLHSNTEGYKNAANGSRSLYSNTEGFKNTANGYYSLYSNTGGSWNTATGYQSLFSNTTGNCNVANGYESLHYNTTGNYNTAHGFRSLSYVTGSNNVALGSYAGYDETGSDKLFIDNADRGSEALGRTSSLIYGIFNSAVADQTVRLNASVGINTVDFGSGKVVLALANASTVPSANPTGGGVIYCEGGALKYRGSSGTITTLANA